MPAGIITLAVSYFLSLPSSQHWSVFCQGISPWALGTDVLPSTAYGALAPSKTLLQSSIYSATLQSCRNIPIRINDSLSRYLSPGCLISMHAWDKVTVVPCVVCYGQLWQKVPALILRYPLSWPVYWRFWLQSILQTQTIGRLQHHQLYVTVIAVKRLITPCQVKGVFILMSWGCTVWETVVQAIIYWRDSDRRCTWGRLKSEK